MKHCFLFLFLLLAVRCSAQGYLLNPYSFATAAAAQEPSTNNLEARWRLDEASGNAIDTSPGAGNTLTDNNTVTSGTGVKNGCRHFTAANTEFFSITDNASLSFGDEPLTITLWIKPVSDIVGYNIVSKWNTASFEHALILNGGTSKYEWYVSNDGSAFHFVQATTDPSAGNWQFIWLEHDPTANTIRISINNGTPDSTSHSTGIFNGTATFMLGDRQDVSIPFDGDMDEVRVYRRLLTSDEIAALASNPPP